MKSKQQTRFNIEITEADIERAHVGDSYKCVVSQAIARAIPDATRIETDIQAIRLTRGGERFVYFTPYVVQGYVVAFDAGDEIHPFSFQLRDPKRVKRQVKTEVGKAAERAATRARRIAKSKRVVGTPAEGAHNTEAEAAKAAYSQTLAAHGGGKTRVSDSGGPKAPPRVFKKKKRSYGHRLLRINQEDTRG